MISYLLTEDGCYLLQENDGKIILEESHMSWRASANEMKRAELGQYGFVYEVGTTAITGNWFKIRCLTATTFATLTGNHSGDTFTAVAHPAGTELFGHFTAITLTSGSVIAYNTGEGI